MKPHKSPTVDSVQSLELAYIFKNAKQVRAFLAQHPFLIPLLAETRAKIADYFPQRQVFLQIMNDPDAESDPELVAYIAVDLSAEQALEQLDRFDRDWWLDAMEQARGKFIVNVEFV